MALPSPPFSLPRRRLRPLWAEAACCAVFAAWGLAWPAGGYAAADAPWPVIGQQGVVRFVLVPVEEATRYAAYEQQIAALCEPERTCFLNFYTNSAGTATGMPLPDAIAQEATATFRRSMKNGVQRFIWSCRLKMPAGECF